MKNYLLASIIALAFLGSCNNGENKAAQKVKPGEILAKEEMAIVGDTLNKFKFSVTVKADSEVEKGVYDVSASWGNNTADSKFTMPKGGEDLKPILRHANKPNAYIIGFRAGKDTTFNEYFEVSGVNGTLKMQYVKSYSFE